MVILWTDALIFILILVILLLAFYLRGKDHIKRPLQKISRSKVGMVSLVVLIFFILIGLLDSVHFKPGADKGNEIISLVDYWATPLRKHGEKTYSAPFAATLYSKEIMTSADGASQWAYPRLQFGGAHLNNPEMEKIPDILQKTFYGFAQGAGLLTFFMILLWSFLKEQHKRLMKSSTAKAVWIVVFFIVSLTYTLIHLSAYYHVFGTDKVGEDVFYQAVKSIRTGLVIGTLTTLIMLPLAIIFGILAGFFRGWIDDVIQYIYTTLNSIPGVLLIAASILMVQVYMANHEEAFTSVIVRADMRLLFLCMILGVTSWTGLCRLLRAETLKLREMEYVLAAQALGVKRRMILLRHILPNVMHIVLISVVLDFSSLVLAEAVLSYINIGVDPTTYSWGNMINGARLEMAREPIVWWSLSAAFIFMFALVLAANLFADTVQDAFDPRRSGSE
ncbi:Peptide/nickel transport system permease protein [Candidatus Methylobacter favarea]|uniref:Peptide/nickel transport system permease protein n=1 Tax=Candidatus Methylobacter favarea TaxID=2707345 RepID=A0A8S0XRT1_9GAMM|nr:ABC transporter permease [Candidatus Methylobacter favarea]CAA9890229.1 Peptide/nickel transport system permease protein [Candidatus Methylobacter favarea]